MRLSLLAKRVTSCEFSQRRTRTNNENVHVRLLDAARKQVAKFDQVKTEDLDLRQNAVQGRPVQKTREQCGASLKLCDHGRKGRQRRWTEMAGNPKCVQISCL